MLVANTEGNTDVATLTGGSALQKDPWSLSLASLIELFRKKKKKKLDFSKSSFKINLSDVNTSPTEAQKEHGNYKMAHVTVHGLDITIENPKGSYRSGTDKSGKEWKCKIHSHYGYFKRTEGKDGDHVDVFIGPNVLSEIVFIVNQNNADGKFDEHKVMLGFDTEAEAKEGYLKNYSPGWKGLGSIISMTIDQFKNWITSGDTKKPAKEFTKSELYTDLEWATYFEKGKTAQVGETRTWTDGTIHKKTADGKWVEVSKGKKPNSPQPNRNQTPGSQAASQGKTHDQRAIEIVDRWKRLEQKAKEKNRERMAKSNPQNRQSLWDVNNARPGDVIRIERASSGRINRGHIGEVLDKVDGYLKVALASGGVYLFPPSELSFAKGGSKDSPFSKLKEFFKGKSAQLGEIREWSDGNRYQKVELGWKLVGKGDKKAHQVESKEFAEATGEDAEKHRDLVEKAMQNSTKIPVKILREYPDLLEKYPEYKNRVLAIDAINKMKSGKKPASDLVDKTVNSMKAGSQSGDKLENAVNSARAGKLPDPKNNVGKATKTLMDPLGSSSSGADASFEVGVLEENLVSNNKTIEGKSQVQNKEDRASKTLVDPLGLGESRTDLDKPETAILDSGSKSSSSSEEKKSKVQKGDPDLKAPKSKKKDDEPPSPSSSGKTSDKLKTVPASDITTIEQYTDKKHYNKKVIDGIKDSIMERGFDPSTPLKVDRDEKGKLRVVDGHHRFTAVQELIEEGKLPKDTPIYVIEEKFNTEADRLLSQVSANKNKRKVERLDDAKAYSKLIEQGKTVQEISKVTGETPDFIKGTLALNNLSDDFKKLLRSDSKQERTKSQGDGSEQKYESMGESLAIVLGKHGINDDGTPNDTLQRKAFAWYVSNKGKGVTVPQVKGYIETLKSQQSLGMKGFDDSGRSDVEKEALRSIGSEDVAKGNTASFDNFLSQIQKPIQKFLGDTVTDLDEKKAQALAASIIATRGAGALQNELNKISEALNNLSLFKESLAKKFAQIQADAQTPMMFGT
ncbi:ParB N-terminal domain-containing protein [Leptospira sp. GIMC2001]|uniref:ParB N-terminal domain-containing protein n=1 Tax=Leptospira sp. GIMC2001 TaxID=1513297 RepID=UPI00234B7A3E|nr:ParB N-terminal domain-containing protein [Leptospira sp. GIMC2001]WCL51516.1 ParB N-terminal domain-containing protein [Leptospira sp. GIMC2001]